MPSRFACLFLFAVLALPACAEDAERSHCFGRFCLALPADFVRSTDDHVVREVTLDEKRWHNPLNRDRAKEFEARTKLIEALAKQRATAASPRGSIVQKRTLEQPAMDALLFYRTDNPFSVSWGALLARGPLDLWLQADADVLAPQDALPRLATVAQAYLVPELNGDAMRGPGVFHLRFGALALPFQKQESSTVVFEAPLAQLRLTVSSATLTPEEVRGRGLLERAARPLPAIGRDAAIVRGQVRLAGGMAGDELVTRPALAPETLNFRWSYAGEADSGFKPRMSIVLEAPGANQAELLALWTRILSSLRPAGR